jgi:protein-S-isoprenylcysteine O-methyltransferase Ste14
MALLVVLGVAVGFLAATPVLFALHQAVQKDNPSIAAGLGAILASFFGIQLVVLAVHLANPTATLPFGGAAALSFLIVVTVAGLISWRRSPHK